MNSARGAERGFTVTELMVVVVIIGIMAAIATPSFLRDRESDRARSYAYSIAKTLQKARAEALANRISIRVYVWSDRIELRSYIPSATPGGAAAEPDLQVIPVPDVIFTSFAPQGTTMWGAWPLGSVPPAPTEPFTGPPVSTHPSLLDFDQLGGSAFRVRTADPGDAAAPGGVPQGSVIYIENGAVPTSHPYRRLFVIVHPLQGFVKVGESWTPGV